MTADLSVVLAIVVMGLATYATRVAGYWLLQGREVKGRLKAAMDAVPPAILVSVIAPTLFMNGNNNMIAGALTVGSAILRLPLLVTIAVGVGSVAALRALSG
jgi:uncharacterized membrane protein